MAGMSLATAVTSSQLGTLVSILSARTLLKAAFLLYGIALFIIPRTPSLWLLLIPTIVFGIGHGTNWPCIYTLLTELAPVEYRATFLAVNGMIFRLGQTFGPLFMGVILSTWGITGTFHIGALLSVAVSVLGVILIREEK
jgi:predicted MFS family arabinose efflux permease